MIHPPTVGFVPAPLYCIYVNLSTGFFPVVVCSCFPIDGIDFIMGNDIAVAKISPFLNLDVMTWAQSHLNIFAVSVLSRAQAFKQAQDIELSVFTSVLLEERLPSLGELVDCTPKELRGVTVPATAPVVSLLRTHEALISAQKGDPSLVKGFEQLFKILVSERDHHFL